MFGHKSNFRRQAHRLILMGRKHMLHRADLVVLLMEAYCKSFGSLPRRARALMENLTA